MSSYEEVMSKILVDCHKDRNEVPFCSVRIYVAVFEIVRVILGFWCLHKICRASSRDHVGT